MITADERVFLERWIALSREISVLDRESALDRIHESESLGDGLVVREGFQAHVLIAVGHLNGRSWKNLRVVVDMELVAEPLVEDLAKVSKQLRFLLEK